MKKSKFAQFASKATGGAYGSAAPTLPPPSGGAGEPVNGNGMKSSHVGATEPAPLYRSSSGSKRGTQTSSPFSSSMGTSRGPGGAGSTSGGGPRRTWADRVREKLPPLGEHEYEVLWERGVLGVIFLESELDGIPYVSKATESCISPLVEPNDVLRYVNVVCSKDHSFSDFFKILSTMKKPVLLRFERAAGVEAAAAAAEAAAGGTMAANGHGRPGMPPSAEALEQRSLSNREMGANGAKNGGKVATGAPLQRTNSLPSDENKAPTQQQQQQRQTPPLPQKSSLRGAFWRSSARDGAAATPASAGAPAGRQDHAATPDANGVAGGAGNRRPMENGATVVPNSRDQGARMSSREQSPPTPNYHDYDVLWESGSLGLFFGEERDTSRPVVTRCTTNASLAVQQKVAVYDVLIAANGVRSGDQSFDDFFARLQQMTKPVKLVFRRQNGTSRPIAGAPGTSNGSVAQSRNSAPTIEAQGKPVHAPSESAVRQSAPGIANSAAVPRSSKQVPPPITTSSEDTDSALSKGRQSSPNPGNATSSPHAVPTRQSTREPSPKVDKTTRTSASAGDQSPITSGVTQTTGGEKSPQVVSGRDSPSLSKPPMPSSRPSTANKLSSPSEQKSTPREPVSPVAKTKSSESASLSAPISPVSSSSTESSSPSPTETLVEPSSLTPKAADTRSPTAKAEDQVSSVSSSTMSPIASSSPVSDFESDEASSPTTEKSAPVATHSSSPSKEAIPESSGSPDPSVDVSEVNSPKGQKPTSPNHINTQADPAKPVTRKRAPTPPVPTTVTNAAGRRSDDVRSPPSSPQARNRSSSSGKKMSARNSETDPNFGQNAIFSFDTDGQLPLLDRNDMNENGASSLVDKDESEDEVTVGVPVDEDDVYGMDGDMDTDTDDFAPESAIAMDVGKDMGMNKAEVYNFEDDEVQAPRKTVKAGSTTHTKRFDRGSGALTSGKNERQTHSAAGKRAIAPESPDDFVMLEAKMVPDIESLDSIDVELANDIEGGEVIPLVIKPRANGSATNKMSKSAMNASLAKYRKKAKNAKALVKLHAISEETAQTVPLVAPNAVNSSVQVRGRTKPKPNLLDTPDGLTYLVKWKEGRSVGMQLREVRFAKGVFPLVVDVCKDPCCDALKRVCVGDVIMEINGKNCSTMGVKKTVNFLKTCSKTMLLKFRHGPAFMNERVSAAM